MGIINSHYTFSIEDNNKMDKGYAILNGDSHPELLTLILLHITDDKSISYCRLVCKTWSSILDDKSYWKRKALVMGRAFPNILTTCDLNGVSLRLAVMKNVFGRNLVVNPYGAEGLKGWQPKRPEGDTRYLRNFNRNGFVAENPPAGADSLDTISELQDVATSCFATTHFDSEKYQVIDLVKEGCTSDVMRIVKPKIYICEWYAARFDCGSVYKFEVSLRDCHNLEVDKFNFAHEEPQWTGSAWRKVEHTFTDTEKVRYIHFSHYGRDTQFWAGHYGSKMTGGTVKLQA